MSKSCILSAPCDVSQNIIDVDVILPFQKNFRELTWWSSQNLIFQKTFLGLGPNVVVSSKFNFPEDFLGV